MGAGGIPEFNTGGGFDQYNPFLRIGSLILGSLLGVKAIENLERGSDAGNIAGLLQLAATFGAGLYGFTGGLDLTDITMRDSDGNPAPFFSSGNSSNQFGPFQLGSGGRIRTLQLGGMAKGPSHQSGMVGYAPGGGPFMFEGGEYIINKRSTEKLGEDRLNVLNSYGVGGRLPEFQEGMGVYGTGRLGPAYARRDLLSTRPRDSGGF